MLSFLAEACSGDTKSQIVNATGYENSLKLEELLGKMQGDGSKRELKIGNAIFLNNQENRM